MTVHSGLLVTAVVVAGIATSATKVSADVLILESDVSSLKRGAQIGDDARLMIPSGKTVMIMRPSGETQEVAGPYDRKVGELSRGETLTENFLRMKAMLEQEAKGKGTGSTMGASRGITK